MQSGLTLQQFNQYFTKCYPSLVKLAQKIDNGCRRTDRVENGYKDSLHDVYFKISNRINTKGFTGNITGYTTVVLRNTIIDAHNKTNKTEGVDSYQTLIEDILQQRSDDVKNSQLYQDEIRELSKYIFQYLTVRYDEKAIFIFKTYYTTPASTYKKIATMTNYSKSFVGEVCKQIKQDLRKNFMIYLKNKQIS